MAVLICPNCGGTGISNILNNTCLYCNGKGRIATFTEGDKSMNQVTMTRRFYKTHSAIQRPSILQLYSEAVANATSEIENGTQDTYYIVEVVAIVRKDNPVPVRPPVIVEEVRKG